MTITLSLIWSCGKDDNPTPDSKAMNTAPIIDNQSFTVAETIPDTQTIGMVKAGDKEDDKLVFSITANDNQLFEITDAGALSLNTDQTLDFETAESHKITVSVTDGKEDASASITINVTIVEPENTAPQLDNQSFEVKEDIEATYGFANIVAEDSEEDELTFLLLEDESELFAISENGEISLVEGGNLDFETTQEHNITVQVSDGNLSAESIITVKVQNVNEAPVTETELQFEVPEDIDDTVIIGVATANDPENDVLNYSISENDNERFEITEDGKISLADNQTLDFETKTEHIIKISVTDGNLGADISVTIAVEDVEEITLADNPTSFVTTWETDANEQTINIGLDPDLVYDFTIAWGDGTIEEVNENVILNNDNLSHTYDLEGVYKVAINGVFPAMRTCESYLNPANTLENVDKLVTLDQWGNMEWKRMDNMFSSCINMVYNATDIPDLSQIETMQSMFKGCQSIGSPDLTNWNVDNVTNMKSLFNNANSFNGDVSNWVVGQVTDMSNMFKNAADFDQDLGSWTIGSIETMENMFDNSGMTPPNSNATLVGWANFVDQNEGPTSISLGMQDIIVCGMGADYALGVLINDNSWSISGFDMQFNLCP
tara:strand:+ start:988 stop:2808 length:1821 start_codon:yes stop_codon:yes gene_type:complete